MLRRRFVGLIWMAVAAPCWAQDLAPKVDELVNAYVKQEKFSGTVLLAKDGKVLVRKGYGMADVELNVANEPQMKFRLGSITKQFTSMAILQLQEKGKLSVNDPVSKFVADSPEAWKSIAVRHLLTHTSGIPNFTSFPEYQKTQRDATTVPELVARFKNKPLDFEPGTKFRYSNSGYVLLGYIVEKASGQSYEDYLKQNIFDPLDMHNTGYDHSDAILKNRALGYSTSKNHMRNAEFLNMAIPFSAGALYSTVDDLYLWDQALYTEKLLPKKALDEMFAPFLGRYAYGWGIADENGRKAIAHGGGINGFSTHIARYPDQHATVIVLANMDFAPSGKIGRGLSAILFGEKYELPREQVAIPLDPKILDTYTGKYQTGEMTVTITNENGHLMAQPGGQAKAELFPESPTDFFLKVTDAQVTFEKPVNGKSGGLTLHQNGGELKGKRVE